LSLHDSSAHIKGKLNEFILEQIGSVEFNPDTLYKTIVEECRTRSKYTGTISSFADLIQKKSITRSQVEGWLDLVRTRQALPEWSTISQQLSVAEKSYKQIDCVINETGSDLPRALLAYYYAFVNTMRASSASVLCPLIVDSPVQQDQDPANATRMIQFALEHVPDDMQLILGSVSLHGAVYDGYSIEIEGKRSLLQSDAYDEVSGIMKPYYDALIRPQANS
jgi:hypothetical protein